MQRDAAARERELDLVVLAVAILVGRLEPEQVIRRGDVVDVREDVVEPRRLPEELAAGDARHVAEAGDFQLRVAALIRGPAASADVEHRPVHLHHEEPHPRRVGRAAKVGEIHFEFP